MWLLCWPMMVIITFAFTSGFTRNEAVESLAQSSSVHWSHRLTLFAIVTSSSCRSIVGMAVEFRLHELSPAFCVWDICAEAVTSEARGPKWLSFEQVHINKYLTRLSLWHTYRPTYWLLMRSFGANSSFMTASCMCSQVRVCIHSNLRATTNSSSIHACLTRRRFCCWQIHTTSWEVQW